MLATSTTVAGNAIAITLTGTVGYSIRIRRVSAATTTGAGGATANFTVTNVATEASPTATLTEPFHTATGVDWSSGGDSDLEIPVTGGSSTTVTANLIAATAGSLAVWYDRR